MANGTMTEQTTDLSQLAATFNERHAEFERLTRKAGEDATSALYVALGCGQALNDAKAALAHGQFTRWIKENCRCSPRWARAAMRIARHWPQIEERAKRQDPAVLNFDTAQQLIAEPKPNVRQLTPEEQQQLEEYEAEISGVVEKLWPVDGPVPVAEGSMRIAFDGDVTYWVWTIKGSPGLCLMERFDGDTESRFTRRPIRQAGKPFTVHDFFEEWGCDPADLHWWEREGGTLPLTPIGHHPFCQCCPECEEFSRQCDEVAEG